jgi:hypothetical protein
VANVPPGWRLFAPGTPDWGVVAVLGALPNGVEPVNGWSNSMPITGTDTHFSGSIRFFEVQATFTHVLRVQDAAAAGPRTLSGTVNYVACSNRNCQSPTEYPFAAAFTVEGAPALNLDPIAGATLGSAPADSFGNPADHVRWDIAADPASVPLGGAFRLVLRGVLDEGWKMYAIDSPPPSWPARVELSSTPPGILPPDAFAQAPPLQGFDPGFEIDVRYFMEEALLEGRYVVTPDAPTGLASIAGTIRFQICHDGRGVCLPPAGETFEVDVMVRDTQ